MSFRTFAPIAVSPVFRMAAVGALATFSLVAIPESASAARCPLGEIYRPSRGICISKDKAIAAGLYRASLSRAPVPRTVKAELEKQVDLRREPAHTRRAPTQAATPIVSKPVVAIPIFVSPRVTSPFGSLVALEPSP